MCDDELWKTIVLFVGAHEAGDQFLASSGPITIQSHYSIMETLIIKIASPRDVGFMLSQFSQWRNLRNFEIRTGTISETPRLHCSDIHSKTFSLFQLTSLTFDVLIGVEPSTMLAILDDCPHLVAAQFSFSYAGSLVDDESIRDVKLKHLESLKISTKSDSQIGQFFQFLTLPSLKVLTLRGQVRLPPFTGGPLSLEGLARLIERSSCSIAEFTLEAFVFPSVEIELALVSMPNLAVLNLGKSWQPISDSTLNRMKDRNFLPKLEIFCAWVKSESSHVCREMLEIRLSTVDEGTSMSGILINVEAHASEYYEVIEKYGQFISENQKDGRAIEVEPLQQTMNYLYLGTREPWPTTPLNYRLARCSLQ